MNPEEQKQYIELQDKLKLAEGERDANKTRLDELAKEIDELKTINQSLFLRVTAERDKPPVTDKNKEKPDDEDDEPKPTTTEDLIKILTKKEDKKK